MNKTKPLAAKVFRVRAAK